MRDLIILALLAAANLDELQAKANSLAQNFEFDTFLYGMRVQVPGEKPLDFILSSYPPAWWATYLSNNYIQIDPVMKYGFLGMLPYVWGRSRPLNVVEHEFMEEAAWHGLRTGVTLPVHKNSSEAGLLSLCRPDAGKKPNRELDENLANGQLMAIYLHESMHRIVNPLSQVESRLTKLTNREMECLKWASAGKSAWEISMILKLSVNTINFHFKQAYKKLKVNNRQQAVAKAIAQGLLDL